jgi:hypothetical protein
MASGASPSPNCATEQERGDHRDRAANVQAATSSAATNTGHRQQPVGSRQVAGTLTSLATVGGLS